MSDYCELSIKVALGNKDFVRRDLPAYLKDARRCLRLVHGKDRANLRDECRYYDVITSILHLARSNALDPHAIMESAVAQFDREETYAYIDVLLAIRAIDEQGESIAKLDTKAWGRAEWSFFLRCFGDELEPAELRQFDKWFGKARFKGVLANQWSEKKREIQVVERRARGGAPMSLGKRRY